MSRRDIIVAHQPEIQIYIGSTGFIIMKQRDWPEDDVNIEIDPIHAETIAKAILALASEAKEAREEWKNEEDNNAS